MDSPTEALWTELKTAPPKRALEIRNHFIHRYTPLVTYVANRMHARLPQNVEQSDLASYGIFGLIDAIEKFDLERKIKFETYATARIKGAIIDGLRSVDWVPRSVRAKARSVEAMHGELENILLRTPTEGELAQAMGMTPQQYHTMFREISHASPTPLKEEDDDELGLHEHMELDEESKATMFDQMKGRLANALDKLTEREKIVLALYYYVDLSLGDVGEVLGVTESRASQIHLKAIERLRTAVEEDA